MLRVAGVRQADLKGYSFAREDVNARALANAYGQTLGQVFTHEMKPYEVEILVAQVGETVEDDELYHILYDGTVMDEEGSTVLGGQAEEIARRACESRFNTGHRLRRRHPARRRRCSPGPTTVLTADQLEVALLDRTRDPPRVPPHQGRRARRHPRPADRLTLTSGAATPRRRAEHRDREQRRRDPPQRHAAVRRLRRGRCPASHQSVGAVERVVDLVGEQHVAGVVELVLRDVDVDPGHVAHGNP